MLGAARDGSRDLAVVIAGALLPLVAMVGIGARALRNEALATERELASLVSAEGARLGERMRRDLADASVRLARGERASLAYADDVRLPGRGTDAGSDKSLVLSPAPPACSSLTRGLQTGKPEDRPVLRDRLASECPTVRSARGRFLVPWLLLEGGSGGALGAWLGRYGGELESGERLALREALLRAPRPETAAWLAATALSPEDSARLLASEGFASLRRRELAPGEVTTLEEGRLVGRFVKDPDEALVGFVIHGGTLARGIEGGHLGVARDLSVRLAPDPAPGPVAAVSVGGGLQLYVTIASGDVLSRRTRESRLLLGLSGAGALVVGAGLLAALFVRIRRARAAGALRTDFVAAVSHELRTPAASLQMLAELSADPDLGAEERAEVAAALVKESRRLSATVERLLALRRLLAEKLRVSRAEVDVATILDAAADDAGLPELSRDYAAPLPFPLDAGALRLAMDNLLANARKHAAPPYVLSARTTAEGLVIEVTDAGPGIAPADRQRIFEPFERAKDRLSEATEGFGIGLTLVRGVARAHGGEASCESDARGSRFTLRLPRARRR